MSEFRHTSLFETEGDQLLREKREEYLRRLQARLSDALAQIKELEAEIGPAYQRGWDDGYAAAFED